jgi:hypothetical protein
MSAPAAVGVDRPTLRLRGTAYPVLLPSIRDPRLHLAAIIVTLQILGQVAFDFQLSIAQILVSLAVAGVLEFVLTFWRQRVLMWPASALLTGNGVAFVLRVPGTEHGDWWSMNGWWIFAGTSAVALLSKYVIRVRRNHVFNPSNIGLVLCFLLLGAQRADPLALWWGPLSPALVVALVLIVVGGVLILRRLRLLQLAVAFWLAFAAGIGVLAASGHTMTAAWHVGPIEGAQFWWLLVSSPEILVFLFFMITDPKTTPASDAGRRAYGVGVGLVATLLIAPQTTEFATKVAILASLALVCAARGLVELAGPARLSARRPVAALPRPAAAGAALVGALAFGALVFAAGIPARPDSRDAELAAAGGPLPEIVVSKGTSVAPIDASAARTIARNVLADLRIESEALRRRDLDRAAVAASGAWLASLWTQIRSSGGETTVARYAVDRIVLTLRRGAYQGPPSVVANLQGTYVASTYGRAEAALASRDPVRFRRTVELVLEDGTYRIVRSEGGLPLGASSAAPSGTLGGTTFVDVARDVGLDFRQGSFRFGVSNDSTAMMGGGLCWFDYDRDGLLDLFVVNSYAQTDVATWQQRGGLPRSALFHNVGGRFEDVSRSAGADLQLRGNGCVAADFNADGYMDLYVTTAGYNVPTDTYDALLWNEGDGTFSEGAKAAGIDAPGWHAGAAVGDVNGDGRPDLFVASYTDPNALVQSPAGFPTNHLPVRDLLYLNAGTDAEGHSTFREVARAAGIERSKVGHGLGALFTDYDRDGRLDLYVANDADPNQLYRNVRAAGLGFRFEEVARRENVADPNAGMGIAAEDFNRDGRTDLFVTNSRGQLHAVYSSLESSGRPSYADARPEFAAAIGTDSTGWGASWADLDLDGDLDLVLANGAIPVTNLRKNAQHAQVIENLSKPGGQDRFASVGQRVGLEEVPRVNGRGLATADYDNDGDLDVAINSIGGRLLLLRNDAPRRHWLEVQLDGFSPGAVVSVTLPDGRKLVREVHAGSSYLSSEDPRVHFGLGSARRVAKLEVRLPDGRIVRRANVAVDRIVDLG